MRSTYTCKMCSISMVYPGYILCRFWYTTYIQWKYMVYTAWIIQSIYLIYIVHILYIHCICYDIHLIIQVYVMYIHYIYIVYVQNIQCITCAYTPPGGWCCGGGQGAERPWVKVSVESLTWIWQMIQVWLFQRIEAQ